MVVERICLENGLALHRGEGRMWDLIVSVPDHCLSFYLLLMNFITHSSRDIVMKS